MRFMRSTLALLAWIVIEIPTTLFVIFVMVKVFLSQRTSRRRNPRGDSR